MLYTTWASAIWHQECERKYLKDDAKFYSLFEKKESIQYWLSVPHLLKCMIIDLCFTKKRKLILKSINALLEWRALTLNYYEVMVALWKRLSYIHVVMHQITLTWEHFSGYCEPILVDSNCCPSCKLNNHFCYQTILHFNISFESCVPGQTCLVYFLDT